MADRKMVSLRLDPELLAKADAFARREKTNRTALVERGLAVVMDEARALPEPAPAERVPSPRESGTEHWRDPSPEEVEDTRLRYAERYPEVVADEKRLLRLARADARARDQDRLPRVGEKVGRREARPLVENGDKSPVRDEDEGSFERLTRARGDLFRTLRTPGSAKGIKPK